MEIYKENEENILLFILKWGIENLWPTLSFFSKFCMITLERKIYIKIFQDGVDTAPVLISHSHIDTKLIN